MAIPADIQIAYTIPGKIPTSITPEYLAESRDRATTIAIIFVGSLAILLALLRSYARLVTVKDFGIDDACALLTVVCPVMRCLPDVIWSSSAG